MSAEPRRGRTPSGRRRRRSRPRPSGGVQGGDAERRALGAPERPRSGEAEAARARAAAARGFMAGGGGGSRRRPRTSGGRGAGAAGRRPPVRDGPRRARMAGWTLAQARDTKRRSSPPDDRPPPPPGGRRPASRRQMVAATPPATHDFRGGGVGEGASAAGGLCRPNSARRWPSTTTTTWPRPRRKVTGDGDDCRRTSPSTRSWAPPRVLSRGYMRRLRFQKERKPRAAVIKDGFALSGAGSTFPVVQWADCMNACLFAGSVGGGEGPRHSRAPERAAAGDGPGG